MKALFSFFLVFILSFGIVQPIGKAENDNFEKNNSKDGIFKNGLLPLPDGEPIVMEPLPLSKEPPPSPEPMPHSQKGRNHEKKNPYEHRKNKGK
ncbi:hypothetical protein [Bacillus taeanensis]|uniref:Uncharacterized protein n=1 Tax=Bacillus taeanensis TaxID=273032 RepID=A0A366XQT5_9BACI|nr:hypothetical protein [Bacillus taeanensis]RBW68076.1 hypothetical protein DS031_18540 [Bacillus taeanensis]